MQSNRLLWCNLFIIIMSSVGSIPGDANCRSPRTRANSGELERTPREFAIGSPTPTLRRTPANVRRSMPNVRRSSTEFARVRPSSPVLRRELANGSPENSFAGGKPSTSNERSPRTTFADGELQFAKKHILDGVNDRSPAAN